MKTSFFFLEYFILRLSPLVSPVENAQREMTGRISKKPEKTKTILQLLKALNFSLPVKVIPSQVFLELLSLLARQLNDLCSLHLSFLLSLLLPFFETFQIGDNKPAKSALNFHHNPFCVCYE